MLCVHSVCSLRALSVGSVCGHSVCVHIVCVLTQCACSVCVLIVCSVCAHSLIQYVCSQCVRSLTQCARAHSYSVYVCTQCVHSLIQCLFTLCAHSVCVHALIQCESVWVCVCACVCTCMHAPSVYIKHLIYPDMTRDSQAAGCREKKHLLWQPKGQWTQATITPREVKQKGWLRDSCQGHDSKGRTLKHFADTTTSSQLFIIDLIRLHESKTLKQIFNFHCMFSCCCSLNGNH